MVKPIPKQKNNSAPKRKNVTRTSKIPKLKKQEDLFTVYNQSIEGYFGAAKKNTATYLQSVTDLQEQLIRSWKNSLNSALTNQELFEKGFGVNAMVPETGLKALSNLVDQTNKGLELENQIINTSIENLRKNIQAFNKSFQTIAQLNKGIVQSLDLEMKIPTLGSDGVKKSISELKKIIVKGELEEKPLTATDVNKKINRESRGR